MKFTVEARLLRAAQKCQAGTDDVRIYLQGVHLGCKGEVEASNGHVAFRTSGEFELEKEKVIRINAAIPAFAEHIEVEFVDEERGFLNCYNAKDKSKLLAFEIIQDVKYPDLNKIIPIEPVESVERIGINAKYFGLPEKVFGTGSAMIVEYRGLNKIIACYPGHETNWPDKTQLLIMPMRIGDQEAPDREAA